MQLLLAVVTAADGAARGESLLVVLIAGAAVLALSVPTIRRERHERARRREVQAQVAEARRRRLARQAMDRARREALDG
jgi:hypothetical protein